MDNPKVATMSIFLVKLDVQVRVIRALVLRELMTRFGRHSLGFFGSLVSLSS